MSGFSTTILATSVFLTGAVGFGAGYLMAPPPPRTYDSTPIVDPDAWNRTGPSAVQAKMDACAPAQEASLGDLQNHAGALPAESALASAAFTEDEAALTAVSDSDAMPQSYTLEPLDGSAESDKGSSSISVLTEADADRVWDSWETPAKHEQSINALPVSAAY
jgi:hypothetical protein